MDLTSIITKTIAELPTDEPRKYIGASSIGHDCNRSIWYGYNGAPKAGIPAQLRTTFDIGKRLESLPLDYLEQSGLTIVKPTKENDWLFCKDNDVSFFQGHMDALLMLSNESPIVVEIKTAKNSSFNNFKNKGLRIWSSAYHAQLQSYMGMSGYRRAVLIAINKDTSEFHHEWVEFDQKFYSELKMRALAIGSIDEPPERINRSPLFIVCKNCCYRGVCHGN